MFGWSRLAAASASRRNRCFSASRGERAGLDHLQGDEAVEAPLAGLVDDAHPAPRDLLQQLEVAEVLAEAGPSGRRRPLPGAGRDRRLLPFGVDDLRVIGLRLVALAPHLLLGGRVEGRGDRGALIGEPTEILLRRRSLAQAPTQLHLEREQLDQQLGPVAFRSAIQFVLDPRPPAFAPGRLVALARRVDPPGPRQGIDLGRLAMIAGHGAGSRWSHSRQFRPLRWRSPGDLMTIRPRDVPRPGGRQEESQVLRIRSRRLATVRRAQPSRSAISSLVYPSSRASAT